MGKYHCYKYHLIYYVGCFVPAHMQDMSNKLLAILHTYLLYYSLEKYVNKINEIILKHKSIHFYNWSTLILGRIKTKVSSNSYKLFLKLFNENSHEQMYRAFIDFQNVNLFEEK